MYSWRGGGGGSQSFRLPYFNSQLFRAFGSLPKQGMVKWSLVYQRGGQSFCENEKSTTGSWKELLDIVDQYPIVKEYIFGVELVCFKNNYPVVLDIHLTVKGSDFFNDQINLLLKNICTFDLAVNLPYITIYITTLFHLRATWYKLERMAVWITEGRHIIF